jgi:hypothetical protein
MPDSYKVMRAFERHDGKSLRKYARGKVIPSKEAAKIPSLPNLLIGGFVFRVPEEAIPDAEDI